MIGIVGGVGPLAGLDIVAKIIEETKATVDQEHLPLLLSSQPHKIADRTAYLLGQSTENPAYALAKLIIELEKAGATVVAIPCNTAHAPRIFDVIREELSKAQSQVKLLHLIEETASFISTNFGAIAVGVLSTTGTKNTRLYKDNLNLQGLTAVEPTDELQELVHASIYDKTYGIKATSAPVSNRARQSLIEAIVLLKKQGAKAIVLGCTELPLAIPEKESTGLPIIDPNRILARALIRELNPDKLK